jgi:hypothetical protein
MFAVQKASLAFRKAINKKERAIFLAPNFKRLLIIQAEIFFVYCFLTFKVKI